jgi:predicted MFS family arabinose efflux permease
VRWLGRALAALTAMLRGQVVQAVGGPARARVIFLFGAVLALSSADSSTVGAVAPQLEKALHIGNAKIGLLSSVALLIGAVFVLPVGLFVDRFKRVPLLAGCIVLWSLASLASAFAPDYSTLLITRLALGAVTAAAGPAIASLTGDYFAASERGRVYAYILAGEAAGTAVGFVISGTVANAISFRLAFVIIALPGFLLARALLRTVPEPLRGGQSRLHPGAENVEDAFSVAAAARSDAEDAKEPSGEEGELARAAASRRGIAPDPRMVLTEDPSKMGLIRATRYILSVRTNFVLIVSQALGYFFLSGLNTFALLYVRGHYKVSQLTAELALLALVVGGVIGTIAGGRITDAMLRRGALEARIWVPAICYVVASLLLIPGLVGSSLTPALWFDVAGATLIFAANPPLDAARLDVVPAGLWGRAQSTRAFLSSIAQALAPVTFGGLSSLIAGIVPAQTPIGTHAGPISSNTATGLEITFLILLVTLTAAGVFLAAARHSYPRDVVTAGASQQGADPPPAPP